MNDREIFNEACVLLVTSHLYCFTAFVPEVNTKFVMGYSFIAVVCAYLFIILSRMCWSILKDAYMKFKKWMA